MKHIEPRHPFRYQCGDAFGYAEAYRATTDACVVAPWRGPRAWHVKRGLAVNMGSPGSRGRRQQAQRQGVKTKRKPVGVRMAEAL